MPTIKGVSSFKAIISENTVFILNIQYRKFTTFFLGHSVATCVIELFLNYVLNISRTFLEHYIIRMLLECSVITCS